MLCDNTYIFSFATLIDKVDLELKMKREKQKSTRM